MNLNIYYYDFNTIHYFGRFALILEFWIEEPDGTRSYWGGQEVFSIADGFRIIDNMKKHSIVKKMF